MNKRNRVLLLKIQKEGRYLLEKVEERNSDELIENIDLQHIVVMALINIGGYVKFVREKLRQEHNEVKWRFIAGVRDVAAHNYDGLRLDDIWKNVTRDVPNLLEQVKGIFRAEGVEE